MNRKEITESRAYQISKAALEHASSLKNVVEAFEAGAEWADKHPNAVSMAYLQSWYQASVDETQEPIWTDKHLEELFADFYLIPKNV